VVLNVAPATKCTAAGANPQDILTIALGLLGEIKGLLQAAIAEINELLKGDLSTILFLEGKVIELSALAQLLATLITVSI
jgi:hypothetical protein